MTNRRFFSFLIALLPSVGAFGQSVGLVQVAKQRFSLFQEQAYLLNPALPGKAETVTGWELHSANQGHARAGFSEAYTTNTDFGWTSHSHNAKNKFTLGGNFYRDREGEYISENRVAGRFGLHIHNKISAGISVGYAWRRINSETTGMIPLRFIDLGAGVAYTAKISHASRFFAGLYYNRAEPWLSNSSPSGRLPVMLHTANFTVGLYDWDAFGSHRIPFVNVLLNIADIWGGKADGGLKNGKIEASLATDFSISLNGKHGRKDSHAEGYGHKASALKIGAAYHHKKFGFMNAVSPYVGFVGKINGWPSSLTLTWNMPLGQNGGAIWNNTAELHLRFNMKKS